MGMPKPRGCPKRCDIGVAFAVLSVVPSAPRFLVEAFFFVVHAEFEVGILQRIFISQTTDFHFPNYRFSFRKLQILILQTTDFHFISFHFVSFRFAPFHFANYSKPRASAFCYRVGEFCS